jgi:hypothetical protein
MQNKTKKETYIIQYPRYKKAEDKRCVLTEEDIDKIKNLHRNGRSLRSLAKEYKTSHTTISYHVKPQEYRDKINQQRYEDIKEKTASDPEYREMRKTQRCKFIRNKLQRSEEMRVYKGKATYKWKKKKIETDEEFKNKVNKQALEAYHKKKGRPRENKEI